jgi:hypothetical protein
LVDADGCGQKNEADPYPSAVRQLQLSPARGKSATGHHVAGRGKENQQQLMARQLLKTKSEIVFGSCGSNSNDDIQNRHLTNMADKQLTTESGG